METLTTLIFTPMGFVLIAFVFVGVTLFSWLLLTHYFWKKDRNFLTPKMEKKLRREFIRKIQQIDCNL